MAKLRRIFPRYTLSASFGVKDPALVAEKAIMSEHLAQLLATVSSQVKDLYAARIMIEKTLEAAADDVAVEKKYAQKINPEPRPFCIPSANSFSPRARPGATLTPTSSRRLHVSVLSAWRHPAAPSPLLFRPGDRLTIDDNSAVTAFLAWTCDLEQDQLPQKVYGDFTGSSSPPSMASLAMMPCCTLSSAHPSSPS